MNRTIIAAIGVFAMLALSLPTFARDRQARSEFTRSNPCPVTGRSSGACPGYQVDHRIPLAAGGADRPHNMQWLSVEQHKAKTRSERQSCVYGCGVR